MTSATPGPSPHVECENIIIKRRRKRLLPPEPHPVTVESCTMAPVDLILSDEARPIEPPPADDGNIREARPLFGDTLTPEDSTGESNPIHSDFDSHSESALPGSITDADHGGQPITVHDFLQDMTRSGKTGRKYGRRNRLGTVKLDIYDHSHSEQCRTRPTHPPSSSNYHIETQTRNDPDRRISVSAYPPPGRVQSKPEHLSYLRRKKRFAKSLAQRLFEADVFSSGTSSRSTGVTPDQNPAHTSSRRPLQFITSLNLTPSMESRIYGNKQQPRFGKARTTSSSSAESEIQPVTSQADDSVPDSLHDGCPAVTTSGAKLMSRNWDGATTRKKRTRARGSPAVMRGSGKRAFRTRHGGGKQRSAQVPHNPFEYVPLPLVRVETASTSKIQRTGAAVSKKPRPGQGTHASNMCGY